MNQSAVLLTKTKTEYLNFLKKFRSLQLSTIGKNGRPESSYAPFVADQNNQFYIYISGLARHTKNLLHDSRAGIMFIEPEEQAENIFARKRLTFDCDAEIVVRESQDWMRIMSLFDDFAGELMQTLRMLADFQLIRLKPNSGLFVKGFGKAYEISGEKMDQLSHVNPRK
ncbi:MAG TPA: HugZ family protein [Candidatus Lambdaproteobacteria bacterium]|jgi:putative heme iron utilization protein|nr:HugZ family protein [Candidatus Lambdaproteobacteria bacterium]